MFDSSPKAFLVTILVSNRATFAFTIRGYSINCQLPVGEPSAETALFANANVAILVTCCWILMTFNKQVPTPIVCFQIFKELTGAQKYPHWVIYSAGTWRNWFFRFGYFPHLYLGKLPSKHCWWFDSIPLIEERHYTHWTLVYKALERELTIFFRPLPNTSNTPIYQPISCPNS